jgi:hypothetical protein
MQHTHFAKRYNLSGVRRLALVSMDLVAMYKVSLFMRRGQLRTLDAYFKVAGGEEMPRYAWVDANLPCTCCATLCTKETTSKSCCSAVAQAQVFLCLSLLSSTAKMFLCDGKAVDTHPCGVYPQQQLVYTQIPVQLAIISGKFPIISSNVPLQLGALSGTLIAL